MPGFFSAKDFSINLSEIFNSKLNESEKAVLLEGKTLIRNTKNYSNIVLKNYSSKTSKLHSAMSKLKPNYLAEIIQIIPEEKNPTLINDINTILCDIPSYKGIPYYSEYNKIWVDLYSEAKIINKIDTQLKTTIDADFIMDPFGQITSTINIEFTQNADFLYYENINTNNIKYEKITCVKQGNMDSIILIFKHKGYWILYGIGGVNAPKIPFLSARIELSFMNRIKTFCNFVFDKI